MLVGLATARLRPFRSSLRGSTGLGACLGACLVGGLLSDTALASPQQPTVTAGQSTITQSGTTTTVHQTTNQSVINWQSFSVAPNEQVIFQQPNAVSISLDRVIGGSASTIAGALSANGRVFLINANGVLFAPGATVNLAGLIATTSDIADSDFMAGKFAFGQASANTSATVVNQGTINVSTGGFAILSAAAVANTGVIRAKLGQVVLAGATAFTMDFDGDGLLQYAVTQGVGTNPGTSTLVEQSGTIAAEGGQVLLTAQAAKGIIQHAINMDGMTEANAVARSANGTLIVGAVTLDGGSSGAVEVTGSIQAANSAGPGGTVQVLGENVSLTGAGTIQAWGSTGGGTVLFGGNEHGAGPQANASSAYVAAGTTITANATATGNGGKVVVWSNDATGFAGTINVEGGAGGGNGGFVETSGKNYLDAIGVVDAKAVNGKSGTWLLDPTDVTITSTGSGAPTLGGSFSGGVFTPYSGSTATIDPTTIEGVLNAGTNVDITTSSPGPSSGNITVSAPITMTATNSNYSATLSMEASPGGVITINSPISVTSGFLSLALTGSVLVNANIQVNDGLTAIGNSASDSFVQTAGTTITVAPTNNQGIGNILLQYDAISLTSVVSNFGTATILPFSSGDSIGIGTATGSTLTISNATLNALTNFEFTNVGYQGGAPAASSITFGGTITLPPNDSVFAASSVITILPGAQMTLPPSQSGTGISSNFDLKSYGGAGIVIDSGATLNIGISNLGLIADSISLPTTQFITNSSPYSTVAIDTLSQGGSIGLGTGEGEVVISSSQLNALANYQGLLWIAPSNAGSVDIGGTVNLPAQTIISPFASNPDCDCNNASITFESGAVVTTASAIPSGANLAGLKLQTGNNGSITQNPGSTISVGGGLLTIQTDYLNFSGAPGSINTPSVLISPEGFQTVAVGTGSGEGVMVVTSEMLAEFTGMTGQVSQSLVPLVIGGVNVSTLNVTGPVSLAYATQFLVGAESVVTVDGTVSGNHSIVFGMGNGSTFTEDVGASIAADRIGIFGQSGATIVIAGSLISAGLEIETDEPGVNLSTQQASAGTIALGSTASIITNAPELLTGRAAETVLFTQPGGSITVALGATINFGAGNLALISDNLSVSSTPGAITGTSRVIVSPSSSDGNLTGPFNDVTNDTVTSPQFLAAEGVSPLSVGIGSASGGWNVPQQLITALSTSTGRLQIGLVGTSGDTGLGGAINFPAETSIWGGDILVQSSANITVTGTNTYDTASGGANGLYLLASWDGQPGGNPLNLSNHGNIGIEPGAVIDVAGFFALQSYSVCSTACNYHPGVLLDGTITAENIQYVDSGVGAHVIVGPNAVLTATGSADTGGILLAPDVGGEISLIGGATIRTGAGQLTLATDKLDLAVASDLTLTDDSQQNSTIVISLASAGPLSISGAGIFIDTVEGFQQQTLSTATIGIGSASGTLQLSSDVLSALSVGEPLIIGDTATLLNIGAADITGAATTLLQGSQINFLGGALSTQWVLTIGGPAEVVASTSITAQAILSLGGFSAYSSGVNLDLTATNGGVYASGPSATANAIQGIDVLTATGTIVSIDGLSAQSATLNGGVTAAGVDVGSLTLTGPAATISGTIGGFSGTAAAAHVTAPVGADDVINDCQIGTACSSNPSGTPSTPNTPGTPGTPSTPSTTDTSGQSGATATARNQIAALAGTVPQQAFLVPSTQSGLGSLDLTGLGGSGTGAGSTGGSAGSQGTGPSGGGNPANSPSGQAAAGPKGPQATILLPGKLVSLPPRPPVDPGIPGLNGENSSLGNSGLW